MEDLSIWRYIGILEDMSIFWIHGSWRICRYVGILDPWIMDDLSMCRYVGSMDHGVSVYRYVEVMEGDKVP